MGTKYSTVAISGYNAAPPADDGSQVSTNQVTWSKHKLKIGDPLKTAIESINSGLVTALDTSVRAVTSNDVLTAADHAKTIQCTATSAGFSVSLGDAATMAAGYVVTIENRLSSTGNVTINLASATDSINNVTNGTKVIPPGLALKFIVASPATGYLITAAYNFLTSPFWVDVGGVPKRITYNGDVNFPAITTKGDLVAATAAGALARVGVSATDGDVLIADSTASPGVSYRTKITNATLQGTTSGATIDFNSIPAWAKKITIMFVGVSTTGTDGWLIQIGDAGGIENSGYLGAGSGLVNAGDLVAGVNYTTGFGIPSSNAANVVHGAVTLYLVNAATNTWVASVNLGLSSSADVFVGGFSKSLTATLDRVRITTVGGTDTFDAGSINVMYE